MDRANVCVKFNVAHIIIMHTKQLQVDVEMRARIIGVNIQMCTTTFDFLFGVSFGNLLLCHNGNLSKIKSLSAAEGQRVAKLTLDVLQSLRNEITSKTSMLMFFWTKFIPS